MIKNILLFLQAYASVENLKELNKKKKKKISNLTYLLFNIIIILLLFKNKQFINLIEVKYVNLYIHITLYVYIFDHDQRKIRMHVVLSERL